MANVKVKPIHMIYIIGETYNRALCNLWGYGVRPIETKLCEYKDKNLSIGTFNPKKVTCKRCLKDPSYIEILDKANHPLFHWRDDV